MAARSIHDELTPAQIESLRRRTFDKIDASGDCWEWTASLTGGRWGGYGKIGRGTGLGWMFAHRAVWELLCGRLDPNLQLDHMCRNRKCVNPDHLEPVSNRVNSLRSSSATAINARKTTCPKGHPYSYFHNGWRQCGTCRRDHRRASYHRVKARKAEAA